MAIITFNNQGVGTRTTGNVLLGVPISTTVDRTVDFVFYNEADSTINISFDVNETDGHFVSTNDQAGNEIFIRDGADQLIMQPLSAAVVTVGRGPVSTTVTTGVTITPGTTTTSHRTVSAEGERLIIETVLA